MHQNALLKMSTRGLTLTQHLPVGEMELEGNLYSNNNFNLVELHQKWLNGHLPELKWHKRQSQRLLFSLHCEKEWV